VPVVGEGLITCGGFFTAEGEGLLKGQHAHILAQEAVAAK
jgi:hypothetical protein